MSAPKTRSKRTRTTVSQERRLEIAEDLFDKAAVAIKDMHGALEDGSRRVDWVAIANAMRETAQSIEIAESLSYMEMERCPHCGMRLKTDKQHVDTDDCINTPERFLTEDEGLW